MTPYSTSSEESEAVEVRIRRRKKRKRPVGGLEKELRQKVAWIQDALKKGDRDRLGQLAASKGGLLSDEVIYIVELRLPQNISNGAKFTIKFSCKSTI